MWITLFRYEESLSLDFMFLRISNTYQRLKILKRGIILPYMRNGKRDYKRENAKYNSRPEVVKKRVERNAARRELAREGLVHKGDGKDVDHKKPLSTGGGSGRSNLRVVPASENRSFSRNRDGSLKSQVSRKERGKRK